MKKPLTIICITAIEETWLLWEGNDQQGPLLTLLTNEEIVWTENCEMTVMTDGIIINYYTNGSSSDQYYNIDH